MLMRQNLRALIFTMLLAVPVLQAQVVVMNPPFANPTDTVTIIFNAALGNAELIGEADVWAHSGVITNLSSGPTAWRHVQGNWGTADAKVKMTALGNNLHSITLHIPTFYAVPANETVQRLAFVFRNQNGSKVGRNADGSDILVDIFQGGYNARIAAPTEKMLLLQDTATLLVRAEASLPSNLTFFVNGALIADTSNALAFSRTLSASTFGPGNHTLTLRAQAAGQPAVWDTLRWLTRSNTPIAPVPSGREEGITIVNNQTVYFQLRAPGKAFAYLMGDFNNWQLDANYEMQRSPDGNFFHIEISGLTPGTEYAYQYYVGTEGLRIADPYAEKVLDPWNDGFIPASTYPNLKPYPVGKTNFPVGVINTQPPVYNWDNSYNYTRPNKAQLVVYELLVRDFDDRRTYRSVIDRLDYLDSLGINAIQLLPVMEFEGNESWGYNPMFFMAPDKYYGPANDLKMLVDSCHKRGIAVILDIALNHAFGQNPMVRLYFDPTAGQFGQPTAESPWFNEVPKHDFNVGYDFNHESPATRYFSKRVIEHWVREYKIDGYRFDLSKGMTQRNTLGSVGAWNAYDQSRIDIWQDYRDHLLAIDSNLYLILEHFADNPEETVLSDMGFMLWGNANHQYNEATMGFQSNLSGAGHNSRGWNDMHLKGFMESHDEERLQFRNSQFGRVTAAYSARDFETGVARTKAAANILFAIPGPKMIWQFGEVAYDFPINYCPDGTISEGCRTANKPIRWDYMTDTTRMGLFAVYSKMIRFRTTHPIFKGKNYLMNAHPFLKTVTITGDSGQYLVATANFDFAAQNLNLTWPDTGWWYELHTGDSLEITSTSQPLEMERGGYRLYTNFKVQLEPTPVDTTPPPPPASDFTSYGPNPFQTGMRFMLGTTVPDQAVIRIYTLTGQLVWSYTVRGFTNTILEVEWKGTNATGAPVADGVYLFEITRRRSIERGRLVKVSP